MTGDEVTRVELGTGRRRWWPIALGVLAAWVVLAVVLGGGDGGDDPAAAPSSTPTTSTPPSAPRSSTTSTTAVPPGTPLLGRETGWHLVATRNAPGSTIRSLDLDTGEVSELAGASSVLSAARPDGVFTINGSSGVEWWPFPFAEDGRIFLGPAEDGWVFPVPGSDTAWLALARSAAVNDVRLFALSTGAPIVSLDLPVDAWVVGATSDRLVVGAAGDTFAIGADGVSALLSSGQPMIVVRGEVLVRSCDEQLRCGAVAVDAVTGAARRLPGVGDEFVSQAGPKHPDGRVVVSIGDPARPPAPPSLLGPDGPVPLLPPGLQGTELWTAAWSPDGSLLFLVEDGEIHVVDPFADGGPRVVTSFRIPSFASGQLAVVQPRTED